MLISKTISLNYKLIIFFITVLSCTKVFATDYFVHPKQGRDINKGLSKNDAFKSLKRASEIHFQPGDRLLLASGETYAESLLLLEKKGTLENPILITSVAWNSGESSMPSIIDFKGYPNGILIEDSSFLHISNIELTGNGYYEDSKTDAKMRCGVLIRNNKATLMQHITIKNIHINNVYYENYGFERGKDEVKTANGTQKYGWGIRVINRNSEAIIDSVQIENSSIKNVSHTGIKLTGSKKNITNLTIKDNNLEFTGGPGIQMSDVKSVHVINNYVSHSGSTNDSRKWGRGSGLWTWSASNVLIEKNKFLYANGPGDSAGAHIDFNCDNVVLQYNISAYNAGGFCEILGNNFNCAYRYNISINDGHRVKGENGAFQEGKILWLSGYQGTSKPRKGPVNSYIYNNTIYTDSTIVAKIAIDNTSSGILIANNIFYFEGDSQSVLGDQYKPDEFSGALADNVFFKNNLFLRQNTWPKDIGLIDSAPLIGNPIFSSLGSIKAKDYMPQNIKLIQHKGIQIEMLPNDTVGLLQSLKLKTDILGHPIGEKLSIGAIEPIK
jgi:hypothetical protein